MQDKYITKIQTIEEYKRNKEKFFSEISEKTRSTWLKKKQSQEQEYQRKLNEEKERQFEYKIALESKKARKTNIQAAVAEMIPERSRYFRIKQQLNKDSQLSRTARRQRLMQSKRNRVIMTHETFAEKNSDAKKVYNLYQCHVRY